MATNYRKKAEEMINPGTDAQIAAARSGLDSTLRQLDESKTGINSQYDTRVSDARRVGHLERNEVSNRAISTGMDRSSIVNGGLAGANARMGRNVNTLENSRAADLSNVEMQKSLMNSNFANTQNSIRANSESQILQLADQLSARDQQLALQQQQQRMQEEAQRIQAQQAARNAQLAREQFEYSKNKDQRDFDYAKGQEERQTLANATAQIGEMEKKRRENEVSQGAKNEFQARYIELVDSDLPAAREMLEANKSDLVARFGYDFYKAMIANQDEFEAQAEAKKQQAEEGSKKPWYQFW